jgi:arsenite methyltransferase
MLQVFDPPMCCSTGVCGPEVDPELVAFASDLNWLKKQGVDVRRFNMSQTPDVFVDTPVVYDAITAEGTEVLPLILVDGRLTSKGRYPSREELLRMVGLDQPFEVLEISSDAGACCDPQSGCC